MQPGSHGGGFFNDEEDLTAAIEREIGPEAAEATRRSLRLARNPRTLTDAERAELRANLEPVLRWLPGPTATRPHGAARHPGKPSALSERCPPR